MQTVKWGADMNRADFEALVEHNHQAGMKLMRSKGDDYAGEEDVLQDFNRVHLLCQLLNIDPAKRPEDTARFLIVLKLDRDANLIGRTAEHESRQDTLQDMHNYLHLYRAMLADKDQCSKFL